jgi:hypothetical protein
VPKSGVYRFDMRKIGGRYDAGSMTPGVIDVAAGNLKEAMEELIEFMPALLTQHGVVKDVTQEYEELSSYNDGGIVEADIGEFVIGELDGANKNGRCCWRSNGQMRKRNTLRPLSHDDGRGSREDQREAT